MKINNPPYPASACVALKIRVLLTVADLEKRRSPSAFSLTRRTKKTVKTRVSAIAILTHSRLFSSEGPRRRIFCKRVSPSPRLNERNFPLAALSAVGRKNFLFSRPAPSLYSTVQYSSCRILHAVYRFTLSRPPTFLKMTAKPCTV